MSAASRWAITSSTSAASAGREGEHRHAIERPAGGNHPGRADQSVRRLAADDVAEGGRDPARPGGVGAERERHETGGDRARADPELDPPGTTPGSNGLRGVPYGLRVPTRPVANWSRFVLPTSTAPAVVRCRPPCRGRRRRKRTPGIRRSSARPATSMLSFTANGMPASAPRATPPSGPMATRSASARMRSGSIPPIQTARSSLPAIARQGGVDHLAHRGLTGAIAVEQPGDRGRDVVDHAPSDASRADEWATAPNTPPCIVTIFSAAR